MGSHVLRHTMKKLWPIRETDLLKLVEVREIKNINSVMLLSKIVGSIPPGASNQRANIS